MIRGALVEQKLFGRYERVRTSYLRIQEELEVQKAAHERTLLTLATREGELETWRRGEGKWCQEVEMRESMIDGLKALNSKKSVTIDKLKENIGHLKHKLHERGDMVKYLKDEVKVEVEKRERNDAYERARSVRLSAETLQVQLKEEHVTHERLRQESSRVALEVKRQHESSLVEIQVWQGRIGHLESEAHQFDIVEDYCNSTLGKAEVELACKAGFDYLEAQLPTMVTLSDSTILLEWPTTLAHYRR